MMINSYSKCFVVGLAGYIASRLPGVLFPADLDVTDSMSRDNGEKSALSQIIGRVNLARSRIRNQLDAWNASNSTWHFLSTSIKDNLGVVLFLLALTAKGLKVPCSRDPVPIFPDELPTTSKGGEIPSSRNLDALSHTFNAKKCLNLSSLKSPDAILSIAMLTIVSCTVMHLGRAIIYKLGNNMLNRIEHPSSPNRAITASRYILVCIAPSDLA